jgi:MSHA biogenesis protein MshI
MKLPWQRRGNADQLVVAWCDQTLAYVRGRPRGDGGFEILGFGVEQQGEGNMQDLAQRLAARGLKGCQTRVMLRPKQYQWLQIEAPGVAPEELRSAARYQIRDMLETHIDDVTLDVLRVGDGQHKGAAHLFVVAAPNAMVRSTTDLAAALRWTIPVIDVQETAQRNLQNALARRDGMPERASAALVLVDEVQAVLTICANDELFYTRRLDIPKGFLSSSWGVNEPPAGLDTPAYTPVGEYVPDYGGGESYGTDYSATATATRAPEAGPGDGSSAESERSQRFLVEVQRSLDLWDRSWSALPLAAVRVYAGARSAELAQWLGRELGQAVVPMDVDGFFPGYEGGSDEDRATCWPLLGLFMRTESRKL